MNFFGKNIFFKKTIFYISMLHVTVLFTLRTFSLMFIRITMVSFAFLSNSVPWMPAMKNQDYICTYMRVRLDMLTFSSRSYSNR